MKNRYSVFWVGGENDGKVIKTFKTEQEAVDFAYEFSERHKREMEVYGFELGVVDDKRHIIW